MNGSKRVDLFDGVVNSGHILFEVFCEESSVALKGIVEVLSGIISVIGSGKGFERRRLI